MLNSITYFFVVFCLMLTYSSAFAVWMAEADFTSCPREHVQNTSGSEGPFNSESECNVRVEQVKRESPMVCARYTCVNNGGTATGSTSAGHEMDQHIEKAISAGLEGQISGGDAMGLVGLGLLGNALLAPTAQPTAAELEARAAAQRAQIAAEIERQRLIKEKNDKMDAEAASTLNLVTATTSGTSDDDLLRPSVKPLPAEKEFDCKESALLAERLEKQGLKKLDINMGKTRKMIKQAEEGKSAADKEAAVIAGEAVAGKLADKMGDFVTNQKTILAMEKKLQTLTAHTSISNADTEILKAWLENGIKAGSAVIDTYEVAKKAKAINFSNPKNVPRKEQMLTALAEFNEKFMGDTGAWELAGEHLSVALGPAGPATFKTAVLGIKMTVNRGSKMISENDLNEQKYHLGNMMKTRAEMAQKVKTLKKQLQDKCAKI